ncbi:hypothetical protein BFJ71_g14728 [Fusarium oxysporum]|nr:hypothetical protein BFJ71_g14728 [Fusarium oxysporum]
MQGIAILGWLTLLVAQASVLPVAVSQQIPLQKPAPLKAAEERFTLRRQSGNVCDAGSRHWTGTVNVTDEKSMFFWYFESRNNPETAPVMIWMSGGPGASGELGLTKGSGPCAVNKDGNSTRRLDHSWVDHANVIYIDQPVGVGFSQISDRDLISVNLHDGGQDLYTFLSIFTNHMFPETADRPWHITGESMGGHYVTGYTTYIIQQERERAAQGLDLGLDIQSAIIVDGYIDNSRQSVGYWDFFCTDWRRDDRETPLMNSTFCEQVAGGLSACEEKGALCRETYDTDICVWAYELCEEKVGKYVAAEIRPGGWNPYDSRLKCKQPPLCSDFDEDEGLEFFNQPWVQEELGFSNFSFSLIDFDANMRWQEARSLFLPTTRELTFLLDDTHVRLLFINGNNDIIVSTPGQMRMLDEQPWSRQPQFRKMEYRDWYYTDGELSDDGGSHSHLGGTWKGNNKLSHFTVDEAGHFSPMNQPEAIGAVVRAWIRI